MSEKDPPQLEGFTRWLTTDWAHAGLLIGIVVIVALVIALWMAVRR